MKASSIQESRQGELEITLKGIKVNPLYRETRREGRKYDDAGNPFFDSAFYLVNCGNNNLVLRSSGGLVLEATRKSIRFKQRNSEEVIESHKFDPYDTSYLSEPPYFVKVASALSHFAWDALRMSEKISIEANVSSPFLPQDDYQI